LREAHVNFDIDQDCPFDRLGAALRRASRPTDRLLYNVIADVCSRIRNLSAAGKTAGLRHLIEAGAWTDAALSIVELELPNWRVRRLVREDGEWFCSLSHEPNLPIELDDTADASHEALPLAILLAFVQARRLAAAAQSRRTEQHFEPATVGAMCCENFA
jgi:hypothetical protein